MMMIKKKKKSGFPLIQPLELEVGNFKCRHH